jgi:hypothetical protein
MLRIEPTRLIRMERGIASGIAASVLIQLINSVGFSKELLLAGDGRKQLLRHDSELAYAVEMTRNKSRRKSGNGLGVAVGERVVRELRQHVSRDMKSATKRVLKAVEKNSKDLEALWRVLASDKK